MSKFVGLTVRIDVSKIDKSRLYKGAKGTYLDLYTRVNLDETDKYDNNGFISQSVTKEEREAGTQTPILGNCKVVFSAEDDSAPQNNGTPQSKTFAESNLADLEDDIPF